MRPGFQSDPTARQSTEDFAQGFGMRAHSLFHLYLACLIQHAVPTMTISQIQSDGEFRLRKISTLPCRCSATLFIAGLLFICASSTSITWERTASRPETGLL